MYLLCDINFFGTEVWSLLRRSKRAARFQASHAAHLNTLDWQRFDDDCWFALLQVPLAVPILVSKENNTGFSITFEVSKPRFVAVRRVTQIPSAEEHHSSWMDSNESSN